MRVSYRTGFWIVSLALVASLAALAVVARRAEPSSSSAPTTSSARATTITTSTSSSPASSSSSLAGSSDAPVSCVAELARCREAGWSAVARTITADLDERARARAAGEARPSEPADPTGPADQRRLRCDIAEQQAREHWQNHRADIHASLRDVGKPAWIASETAKSVDKAARELGANASERERLQRGYEALYAKYGPTFQREVGAEPVDDAAILVTVQAYWRDEDAMVEGVMGAAGLAELRAFEARTRTAIAAILAALSNKPYDDALAW
jgi:hypothetical protein